jgi:hypothetical protein
MNNFFSRLAPAAVLCLPLAALAQTARPEPADAKASAPQLRYLSAFTDYKPWQDAKLGDWRALNDILRSQAAGGGGHAGHAMPMPAPASAPNANKPASAHGGRHPHGGKQ